MVSRIRRVHAREVFDSRGRPTVEADVELDDGSMGRAIVPSGASTGQHEAHELRDGDLSRYGGLGVRGAVANVRDVLGPGVCQLEVHDQSTVDARLRELDGSANLGRLGANAVLAVSMAACRAAASSQRLPLWRHIADLAHIEQPVVPLPMVNILSGGAHARGGMDVQDFLAIAVGAASLDEALLFVWRVRTAAAALLADEGRPVLLADEGGFSPGFLRADEALQFMVRAIERAGLRPGDDVAMAIDVASTQLVGQDGVYDLRREGLTLSSAEMCARVADWLKRYPIVSIEDPLAEDDWPAWNTLTQQVHCQLIGDDLFCTNPARIQRGIDDHVANAVLIKVNQIGTVSDALEAVALSSSAGYRAVVSARSGETEDSFIADLAVGTAAGQIKVGSLATSERLGKYNQLVRIAEDVGGEAFSHVGAELARR